MTTESNSRSTLFTPSGISSLAPRPVARRSFGWLEKILKPKPKFFP